MPYPYQDFILETQTIAWTHSDGVEKSVTLSTDHKRPPIVAVSSESSDNNMNFFVESVTLRTATIGCSNLFNGIVHLQAISVK
tara:strand:- start:1309 stop:1557 length:249 start_codon:yes stop_codon:yes gene_type:complete